MAGIPLQPPMPSADVPIADPKTGRVTIQWQIFLAGLSGRPGAFTPVTAGASPFVYTASTSGQLAIVGGTVSGVTLNRARVTFDPGQTAGFFPMGQGDVATITFSAAPTVYFVPG